LLLALLGMPSSARAQYYVPPPYCTGPGGALRGKADVINANGAYLNQIEQVLPERVRTRKAIFDEMLYEKAMTPTNLQKAAKEKADRLEHMLKFATANEITSGEALNVLLPYLQALANHGIQGPPVDLRKVTLNQINLSANGKTSTQLLRRGNNIFWPLATRGPDQKHLAELLDKAVEAAIEGTLDLKMYNALRSDLNKVRAEVNRMSDKDEISLRHYFDAKYFLNDLDGAISMLQQPNVGKFLKGNYAARGHTVQELIDNMSEQGVLFAPALPGQEAPYRALYNAVVAHANGAEDSPGFGVLKCSKGPP
jgi:hypothetical protein